MKFIIQGCEPGISGGLIISHKESVEDFSMARARARVLAAQKVHPIVRIVAEGALLIKAEEVVE
jgi:hypothetical protein